MGSGEVFEYASHPLRVRILKLLSKGSMGFSGLKRALGVRSSGKLDFHIKKLGGLVRVNGEGRHELTRDGYAALRAVDAIERYGWQRRAYIVSIAAYVPAADHGPVRPLHLLGRD